MRTPSIATLAVKVEKLEGQVSKLEAKKIELAAAKVKLSELSSDDNVAIMRERLAKKREEAEKLASLLESLESDGEPEGETVTVSESDIGEISPEDLNVD